MTVCGHLSTSSSSGLRRVAALFAPPVDDEVMGGAHQSQGHWIHGRSQPIQTRGDYLIVSSLAIAKVKPASDTGMVTGLRVTDSMPMFRLVPDFIALTSSGDSGVAA